MSVHFQVVKVMQTLAVLGERFYQLCEQMHWHLREDPIVKPSQSVNKNFQKYFNSLNNRM